MPRIAFFEPARLAPGYEEFTTFKSQPLPYEESCMVGNYRFWLIEVKPVNGLRGGRYDLVGYEKIYENVFISQEEADQLWAAYVAETNQEGRNN